jgi:hypothetical protein
MKRLLLVFLLIVLSTILSQAEDNAKPPQQTVKLTESHFRLIRELPFQGKDLFKLAIEAGMYKKKEGQGYLPGDPRGEAKVAGRVWHGSNGVGLVANDPATGQWAIYYLQEKAVRGHHLSILYADEDYIFFDYGYHEELPGVVPAIEVYSTKRNQFARIAAVTSRGGKFGYFDSRILEARRPGDMGPSGVWDYRQLAEKEWVSFSEGRLAAPRQVSQQDGVFTFGYNTDWQIPEFATVLSFSKADLERELDRIAADAPAAKTP